MFFTKEGFENIVGLLKYQGLEKFLTMTWEHFLELCKVFYNNMQYKQKYNLLNASILNKAFNLSVEALGKALKIPYEGIELSELEFSKEEFIEKNFFENNFKRCILNVGKMSFEARLITFLWCGL